MFQRADLPSLYRIRFACIVCPQDLTDDTFPEGDTEWIWLIEFYAPWWWAAQALLFARRFLPDVLPTLARRFSPDLGPDLGPAGVRPAPRWELGLRRAM